MPAAYQDQFLETGTTFNSLITLTDSYGVPYDLNNFNIASQARTSYINPNVAIQFVTTIQDPVNGVVNLSANSSVTANVVPNYVGKLVYDVILTDTNTGNVTRVLEGQIYVSPGVTNAF
jgi:hypothetical protein